MLAFASPATEAAAAQKELNAALDSYNTAQKKFTSIQSEIDSLRVELDEAVAVEEEADRLLNARIEEMYRFSDYDMINVLFGSSSISDLISRWGILSRISETDRDILADARLAKSQVEQRADSLLIKQQEMLKEADQLEAQVASARKKLASSKAALKAYNERVAAAQKAAAAKRPTASKPSNPKPGANSNIPQTGGSGAWSSGVASHYSWTFSGRGASGERIGPDSMMLAHKTLPFGTLIEFEYKGRTVVAKVADRGPYTPGREFDLGPGTARALNFKGVHTVRYRIIR